MNKTPDTPKNRKDKAARGQIMPQSESEAAKPAPKPVEIGGRGGLDPVRYGDWEVGGKCTDF